MYNLKGIFYLVEKLKLTLMFKYKNICVVSLIRIVINLNQNY